MISNYTLHQEQGSNLVLFESEKKEFKKLFPEACDEKITTAIVGNSADKDVLGWELSDKNKKVVVKHFSGLTTEGIKTYINFPPRRDPNHVIIHVGTNDVRSSQDPETIAKKFPKIVRKTKIKY